LWLHHFLISLCIVGLGLFILILSSKLTPYLYFARIPLLSLLLFAAVTPFLATHNLKSLLIGVYDLTGFSDGISGNRKDFLAGVALGLVLVLCGMTIYTAATLAMELGPVRADGAPLAAIAPWKKWVLGLIIWIGILLNVALVWIASTSGGLSTAKKAILGLAIGIAVAALLWLFIEWFVQSLQGSLPECTAVNNWVKPDWLRGYISSDIHIELKHLGALLSLLMSLALYILVRRSFLVPVIYLLLLLIVSTWALTALSFLLDYFRVPILVPLGL
jgi:hypothetical protein